MTRAEGNVDGFANALAKAGETERVQNFWKKSLFTPVTLIGDELQKDVADRIGTQREVVTRELSALKRAGLIESTRGGLVLLDPDGLNNIISDALTK